MNRRSEHPMIRKPRRASMVLAAALTVVLLGSTSAYAYWTTLGSGDGAAAAGTFIAPTVNSGTAAGPALYPGMTSAGSSTGGTLSIVASNPNPFPISVLVSQNGAATGCATPAVTFDGGSFNLAAGASNVPLTLPDTLSVGTTSSNDCQGATITVPLTTSSTSN